MSYDLNIHITKRFFNDKFFPYLHCQCPLQIIYGGASSGKSVFAAQRRVIAMIREPRNYIITRKVADTIRTSVFSETEKAIYSLRLQDHFNINKSTMEIEYNVDGRKMYFRGLDDVAKIKSITVPVGVITDIEIEEATEVTEDDYEQLDLRMRGIAPCIKRMCLYFNPIFRNHWIIKKWFNGQWVLRRYIEGNILILHSNHKDNKFLDQQDHDKIESKIGYFHDVYAKGKPGVLGDLILTNWTIGDCKDLHFDNTVYGLDFGFSNDPAAVLKIGVDKSRKTLYIQQEVYVYGSTNDVLAAQSKQMCGLSPVWCDNAEPKSIREMHNQGENRINAQPVIKGKDSVWHAIQWLQQWNIVIDKGCIETINEVSCWQWMKNKQGEKINEPAPGPDHAIAALRYGTEKIRLGAGVSCST